MKQSKILLISMSVLAMLLIAGCSQPSSAENVRNADNPAQDNAQPSEVLHTHNAIIINTSHEGVEVDPTALSIEEAAQVGAQYILDIFGESIDGMYLELEFADWGHVTRTLWHGAVSVNNRNILENRARNNELNDIFVARLEAGEEAEDIMADMADMFRSYSYTQARFYFFIDAITGERIDIWQSIHVHPHHMDESIALHEYIAQEWGDDWEAAFAVDITQQEKDALSQIATEYAQRHFNNSTVISTDFENAFASFIYAGGGFNRDPSATFLATNNVGREARITIHLGSNTVTSINTMSNDFIPMDVEAFEGERGYRSEDGNDGQRDR